MTKPASTALSGLKGQRLAAARELHQDVLLLAGPGAGKTELLTRRAAWLAQRHEGRVVLLTFSKNAATGLRQRIAKVLDGNVPPHVFTGTIHSYAMDLLQHYGDRLGLPPRLEGLGEGGVDTFLDELRREGWRFSGDFRNTFEKWRRFGSPTVKQTEFVELAVKVDQEMRRRGQVDYSGQIIWTTELLRRHEQVHASVRHHDRFLFVDEAQDCDQAQLELFDAMRGPSSRYTIAMDPDQSLYGWRDAKPELVRAWAEERGPRTFELTENYRCRPRISRLGKLVLDQPDPGGEEGNATLYEARDENDEAAYVGREISRRLESGGSHNRIAVLCAIKGFLDPVRKELLRRGIRVRERRVNIFTDEENSVLVALDAALGLQADRSIEPFATEVLGMSPEKFTDLERRAVAEGKRLETLLDDPRWTAIRSLVNAGSRRSPVVLVREVATILGYSTESVSDLEGRASSVKRLTDFLKRTNEDAPEAPQDEDAVLLSTFHGAKGLEFDVVFVVGVQDRIIPNWRSQGDAAKLLESRRTLYVAITRASHEVLLSWNGRNDVSPFLPPRDAPAWSTTTEPDEEPRTFARAR